MESEEVVASEVRQGGRQVIDVPQGKVSAAQVDREVPPAFVKWKWNLIVEAFWFNGSVKLASFFATSLISELISARTCVLPHTPTDGVARTFSLTPMPQLRIKLTSVQLQLFEGP